MAYQKVYMNQIHSSSLLCQLSQMWRGEVLCDAFIRTGNITTKAHRVVLVAACPMLQSMDGAAIGSQLEVKLSADIKKESVMAFLQYLYEGFMMLSEDNVRDVEKISRLLQVDSVTKCCSDFHRMLKKATGRSVASDAQLRYTYADQAEFKHVRTSELLRSMQNGAEKRTSESDDSGRKRLRGSQFSSSVTDDSSFMLSSYTNPAHESQRSPYSSSHSHRPRQRQVMEDSFELVQTELDTAPGSQGRPLPGRPANTVGVSVASQINPDPDVQIVSLPETSDSTGGVMSSARPSASAFSASPANKTPSSFNFGGSLPSPSRRAGSQTMSPSVPSPVSAPKQTRPLPLPTITPKQEVISKDMPTSSPSMPSPSQSKSATSSVVSDDGRSKDSDHPEQIIIQPMSLEASQMSSSPIPDSSRQSLDAMIESDLQAMAASAAATPKDVPKSKPSATVTSRSLDDASDGSKPIVPDLSIVKIEKASARPSTSTAPGHDSDTGGLDMQVDVPPGMEDYGAVEDDDDDGSEIEMWGSFDQSGKFSDQGNSMYIQSLQESGDYGAGMGPGGSGQGPGMSRQSAGRGLQIDYANYIIMEPGKPIPSGYRLLAPGCIVAVPEMWYEITLGRCKGKSASYTLTAVTNGLIRPWEVRKGGTSAYDGTPLEPVIDALKLFGEHMVNMQAKKAKHVINKAFSNLRRKVKPNPSHTVGMQEMFAHTQHTTQKELELYYTQLYREETKEKGRLEIKPL